VRVPTPRLHPQVIALLHAPATLESVAKEAAVTFPSLTAPTALSRYASGVQALALSVLPHGGQRAARRNAWSSMSSDAALARNRREADHAMARATARAAQHAEAR
jgi:hypothetical protein